MGITLTLQQVKSIQSKNNINTEFITSLIQTTQLNDSIINHLQNLIILSPKHQFAPIDSFEYNYHINNIIQYAMTLNTRTMKHWDQVRDSCMFENYKSLEKHLNLYNEKMIGIWGSSHTNQKESEGISWFASKLKKELNKIIYSYSNLLL